MQEVHRDLPLQQGKLHQSRGTQGKRRPWRFVKAFMALVGPLAASSALHGADHYRQCSP